jgi:uncharacterized protein (TIGR00369 family)
MAKDLIALYNQYNNYGRDLGMDYSIPEPGLVEYRLKIEERHLATPGAAHGGVLSAFMDAILGVAALSAVHTEGKVVSTVEFKINFFSPALLHDELIGTGRIEQKGNRIIVTSGEIVAANRNKRVIAKAMGTFNAYPAEKAGM